ncbi:MAG: RDD family protein [Planctomycetes bacterium]|nr:RDD family protein [Planctomycetota bacterium]
MTVTADRFDDALRAGPRVVLQTPEGVPLVMTLASVGERAYAFTIDCLFAAIGLLALLFLSLLTQFAGSSLFGAVFVLAFFLLRNGWFLAHELRSGRTPGKRRAALRVVDARGGPLEPLAVVVRNLTREVEVFVPLVLLANPDFVLDQGPGLVRAVGVVWVAGFALVPFFDKKRRRIGDLLAGTLVVREPRHALQADLVAGAADGEDSRGEPAFEPAQLAHYGVYELQVLEKVLREEPTRSLVLDAVAEKVMRRIGWTGDPREFGGARPFLAAFYRAQRARLEHDLALGRARQSKTAATERGSRPSTMHRNSQ